MSDNRKISVSIPSWNRYQQTIDSFAQVLEDERITEVVVVDDASTNDSYEKLCAYFVGHPKVKLFRNEKNLDCYANKHEAALKATGSWIIIFDSDNTLTTAYLDAIYAIPEWNPQTVYQPQFSRPYFDFRKWTGLTITKENVAQYADTHLMTALNAFNLFINREEYLKIWDGSVNPGTSDSIFFNYCWLVSGNKVLITPGLEYNHYIAKDKSGHYETHSHKFVVFHEQLMNEIRNLK